MWSVIRTPSNKSACFPVPFHVAIRQHKLHIMVAGTGRPTNLTHNLVVIAAGMFYHAAFVTRFISTLTSVLPTYR